MGGGVVSCPGLGCKCLLFPERPIKNPPVESDVYVPLVIITLALTVAITLPAPPTLPPIQNVLPLVLLKVIWLPPIVPRQVILDGMPLAPSTQTMAALFTAKLLLKVTLLPSATDKVPLICSYMEAGALK